MEWVLPNDRGVHESAGNAHRSCAGSRNPVGYHGEECTNRHSDRRKHPAMPRIRPTRFVHVVYRTRQFDKMIAWYQAVFDCKVQYQNPVLAFLTYDDEHHRVAIINLAAVQPASGKDERRGVIGV